MIYFVPKQTKLYAAGQNTGILPSSHENYFVKNIGRVPIRVKVKYGLPTNWFGNVTVFTLNPTESKLVRMTQLFYVTGVYLYNDTTITRAIVRIDGGLPQEKSPDTPDLNLSKFLKPALGAGVKLIPEVGTILSGLITAFWPENKPNVWEQIQSKIQGLLDQTTINIIRSTLDRRVVEFKRRILSLKDEVADPGRGASTAEIREHYTNIALDLIGFEENFRNLDIPNSRRINFEILPHYSNVVMLKVQYYNIGIINQKTFGLTDVFVHNLKTYLNDTLLGPEGAIQYVVKVYKESLDESYETSSVRYLYDNLMTTRTHVVVHGLEFIPIWQHLLSNPGSTQIPYVNYISYSTHYAGQSAQFVTDALQQEVPPPLTPKLLPNGRRDKLAAITIYIWRIDRGLGPPKIGGAQLRFESGDNYSFGTQSGETSSLELKGAHIKKLRVEGDGALDRLSFFLSDGRKFEVGTASNVFEEYEIPHHGIVSLWMSSEFENLGGQAGSLAVSYQLLP